MFQLNFKFQTKLYFLLFFVLISYKQIYAQNIDELRVSGKYNNVGLINVLKSIEGKYPVHFFYKSAWFEKDSVKLNFLETPMKIALDRILDNLPYTFEIIQGNNIIFLSNEETYKILGSNANIATNNIDNSIKIIGNPAETGKYKKVALSGIIKDGKTDEPIIGATVQAENTNTGVITNLKGSYSMTLPPGDYNIIASSVGYERNSTKIKLISKGELEIELFEKSIKIDEIVLYAQRPDKNVHNNQMSIVELDAKSIKQLPAIVGEKDIIKSMTMLPGVSSVGEFGSGINVRGSGEDQNLYLLQGAPLFNTAHVFGLLSVVNPDIVSNVTLYKGYIPANLGERVSSVMEILVKDKSDQKLHLNGGIGLFDSRMMVEMPIYKDNLSIKFGGRSDYSNWLLKELPDTNLRKSSAKFYDLNGLLNWNFNKNKITIFGYTSYDNFQYINQLNYEYRNNLGSFSWNHYYSNKMNSSIVVSISNYTAAKTDYTDPNQQSLIKSNLTYKSLKYNLNVASIKYHNIDAGFQVTNYQISPGKEFILNVNPSIPYETLENEQAYESALFINDKYDITDKINLGIGIRLPVYFYVGPRTIRDYMPGMPFNEYSVIDTVRKSGIISKYYGFEPRVSVKYQLDESSSLKLSYNRDYQFISLITYTAVPTPNDIWKLSDPYLKPITCDQVAFGFYKNFRNNTIETSIETYYKKLKHLIDYKADAQVEMNENIETELTDADGMNYGIEFFVKKNGGLIDGSIAILIHVR